MDNGGSLYIESVNLGKDHEGTSFFDYLGIQYIDDGGEQEVATLKGGGHPITTNQKFDYLGGYSPHYSIDRIEADESEKLFSSESGYGRMFINETAGYKAISSSILMGALRTDDSLNMKAYLISEMVNCFIGYNPVTSLKENIPAILNTGNYPNPFNGNTTIQYTLTEAGPVEINICNVNGQVVRHLVSEEKLPGEYNIVWDATNDFGGLVNDGFYFYTLSINNFSHTEKMIMLR